ncbi:receptor-like kinase TMK4 [Coffea arabica]|uniref:non-specific serine/threonine protein kinase n=1 Tax=Coffea arabica TaxID=13443 RepID=A0A6P6WFJ9_COFAR|nr:receptor-like kinase TMK4 [Coffea arabica]
MRKGKQKFLKTVRCLQLITTLFIYHVFADDAAIMAELAKGFSNAPPGWSGNTPCKWTGVQCDSSGRVISIILISKSLSGKLPSGLNKLSSLQSLNFQRNQLLGPLPSLSNLTSLREVYLDGNNFTSVPPDFLMGLTSLQTFSIGENLNLPPWTIPNTLADSTALVSFIANKANIAGEIPDIFGSFPSLQSLRLSYNNITGGLPPSFAESGIQNLWLNNQIAGLSGGIDVLGAMSQVTQVWLHVNKFSGPIPDLSGCKSLFDLQLRDNQLTGVIPPSLSSLPELQNVTLENNLFQGPVPKFPAGVQVSDGSSDGKNNFCNTSPGPCALQVTILLQVAGALNYPSALAESWKGNNPCQNWRFIVCDSGSVSVINFGNQNFPGLISPAIANLTSLRTLDMHANKLTGSIPATLTSLTKLKVLDVSNNNLSGKIPEFAPGVSVKTSGNPFIGIELPPSFPPGNASSGPIDKAKASVSPWIIVVIIVVAVVMVVVLGFIVYRRYYVKKLSREYKSAKGSKNGKTSLEGDSDAISSDLPSQMDTENYDFHFSDGISVAIPIEVLREATNHFSEENILGEGGFGIVYKGQLHDGTQIAVKRMESSFMNKKGLGEFRAEIEVLSKVRHKNLVALHGFCVNGNERLLVYEYMPQGTLGQHLISWQERGTLPLTWKQRLSIALDVARGVEYLHGLANQSFIHRDLKPSNILLGDDMRAKVSDFGLVKIAPDGKHSVETRLAGTFGYLAPEYAATGRVTTKVDVYAFGVILMELITGQKALDDAQPEEKAHLVTWFRRVIFNKDEIRSSLDPSLRPDEETFKSIWKVAELAAHCTARDQHQRPIMGHAVNVLSPLVEQWMPGSDDEEEDSFGIDLNMSLPQALQRWKANEEMSTNSDLLTDTSPEFTSTPQLPSRYTSSFS